MHAPLGKSDHSLIKILYRCQPEQQADKMVCNYEKADFTKMNDKFAIDWDTFFDECKDDVDLVWERFIQKYNEAERDCIPKIVVTTSKKRFNTPLDRKTLVRRKKKI